MAKFIVTMVNTAIINTKVAATVLCAACIIFVSFLPAEPARAAWAGTGFFTKAAPAARFLNLSAPEQVVAGKNFTLSLNIAEDFPLLANEDAAFFESYEGGRQYLTGICTIDAQGAARMHLQREKAGVYHYSVLAGPFQSETLVTVLPGPPAFIREIQEPLFLEIGRRATVEFSLEDSFGNKITADRDSKAGAEQQAANLITVTITDPEQNLLPPAEFKLASNPAGNFTVSFVAEKIGNYMVECRLLHAAAVSACNQVRVQELGAITGIDLALQEGKEPFLRISKNRTQPGRLELEAILHGENNLTKVPSPAEERNIIFSTDRPDLLLVEETARGSAILTEKGKSGLATVTVAYLEEGRGLQKNIPLWIAGNPAQIKFETDICDLTAKVEISLLDADNQLTWEKTKHYRLDLPSGLNLAAQNEFAHGKAEFTLKAEDYGSYTLGFTAGGLRRNLKIDFSEKIKPARHAVIFIGQETYLKDGRPAKMSLAPEICYGRVFVPVDFLTDAFGVNVSSFPGTERISLQSPDGVKMIIDREAGQLDVTNAKDGTTVTTPIGTLFLQEKAGTFFVPAGIIARLLGIEVDYLPKRDQIEHVTFMRK